MRTLRPRNGTTSWRVVLVGVMVAATGCGWWGSPEPAPEVADKVASGPETTASIWAGWAATDEGVRTLWDAAALTGDAFPVGDRAILLVGTGESGSCPLVVTAVDVAPALVELRSEVDYPNPDRACTDDFNPVTFVIVLEPADIAPPFTVTLAGLTIEVEALDRLYEA